MSDYYFNEPFVFSQYESIAKKFDFIVDVDARYVKQSNITYVGNELIEALPAPFKDPAGIYKWLYEKIDYSDDELKKSKYERKDFVSRLNDFFLPLPNNLLVCEKLYAVIRKGYTSKRIFGPGYLSDLKNLTNYSSESMKCVVNDASNSTVGCLIVGDSGTGKSTALNKALQYYPKAIRHRYMKGRPCLFTQIPYIKVECPTDANLKSICIQFFKEIDKILGTNYKDTYGKLRYSKEYMMECMAHLSIQYAIGALIIDEIQNIGSNKNGDDLSSFFVKLSNELRIPIIYIGTFDVVKTVLFKDFKQSKRSNGKGMIQFFPLFNNEWLTYIKKIWKYQWTNIRTELTQELIDCFYICTAGIMDNFKNLFVAVQEEAIDLDCSITPKLITRVNKREFEYKIPKTEQILQKYSTYKSHECYPDLDSNNDMVIKNNSDNDRMLNAVETVNLEDENSTKKLIFDKLNILGYSKVQMQRAYDYIKEIYKIQFETFSCEEISKILATALLNNEYKDFIKEDRIYTDPSKVLDKVSKEVF